MSDCIAAVATPPGTGGVAIIRISGQGALDIALKMFRPSRKGGIVPNRMYAGKIIAEGFTDYGFMVYFAPPHSFTGEDVVEFHCHGGVRISRAVLSAALSSGARMAEAGEFTRRAFLNGKLSLAAAEGMADMINAESDALLRAGSLLYFGKLSDEVTKIQDSLKDILAAIAAELDYPEEDPDELDFENIKLSLKELHGKLSRLVGGYSGGKFIKEGVTVAICGKPNAGKSSLLNALLGYDKAIVSDEAGTTRDAVEGTLQIGGVLFRLTDTAGLRDGAGKVESIGIERAKNLIRSADIVLFLTEGEKFEGQISGKLIKVFSKDDLLTPKGEYDIAVSSVTGDGLSALKELLYKSVSAGNSAEAAFVVEQRHYNALSAAEKSLCSALQNMDSLTADLLAVDLRECWRFLGEITGETCDEEIVNTVFAKFCVGK